MEEKLRQIIPLLMSENRADREMAMQLCEGQGVDKIEAIKAAIRETRFEVNWDHPDIYHVLTLNVFLERGAKIVAFMLGVSFYAIDISGRFRQRESPGIHMNTLDDHVCIYRDGDVLFNTLINDKDRAMHLFKQKAPSKIDKRISDLEAEIAALKASKERISNL